MLTSIKKCLIVLIVILACYTLKSFALVKPSEKFFVADYADILDSDLESHIINTNVDLSNKTGVQVVVVTVKNLEGNSLDDYSLELYRSWEIGDKTKNNGVLVLLALEERQSRIEVGYGLEEILTDGKTGRIQDNYMTPYFKEDNWNEGIRIGFDKIVEELAVWYNVTVDDNNSYKSSNSDLSTDEILCFVSMCYYIFCFITVDSIYTKQKTKRIRKRKMKKKIKITCVTFVIAIVACIFMAHFNLKYSLRVNFICLIFYAIGIIITMLSGGSKYSGGGSSSSDYFGGSSSGGSASSGGGSFSGGGGSCGGGGSSRSF